MTGTRSLKIVQNMTKEALKTISEPESIEEPIVSEKIKSQLPEPKGWKILVAMPLADEKTKGGILKAASTVKDEELSNICGYILQLGKECYQDSKRFPSGPWCKKGDWVIFARYAGSRIKIDGGEIRLLNDDEVLATVDNPKDIYHEF